MKNLIRDYFIIIVIIILVFLIIDKQTNLKSESATEKIYGYSMFDRDKEKEFEIKESKEQENYIEDDKSEKINIEEINPLFDSTIDIKMRIDEYLGYDKDYTSFIYYNLMTGETISFNEDIYMNAASTYKVGLNVVANNMVNNGEITLDDLVYYSPWQFQAGTGVLQYNTSFGGLPLKTLLEYSIRYSDNIAATMVYTYVGGWTNYKYRLFNILGIDYGNYDNITSARVELEVLKYIYKHRNDSNYDTLIENMKNTDFHDRLDKYIPYEVVAHKIGSDEGFTHDIGIVFTEEPYIIIMMTDNVYNGPDKIADISKAMYLYNIENYTVKISTSIKPKPYMY